MRVLLAVDPGREKCGLAVVGDNGALHKGIVSRESVLHDVEALAAEYAVGTIIVGDGTGGGELAESLRTASITIPIELVDETLSSQRARARFLEENPPKGLRRLIPRGLLTPDRPYDDYVALILAEDYLKEA